MQVYYDKDADLSIIRKMAVAVIGYWLVAAFELRTLERVAPGVSR